MTEDRPTPAPELDTDGVPRGQAVVDDLIRLLDLERLEDNLFRGVSPEVSMMRVFGGQVAAQALVAAARTVPLDRHVHSLHAYFIRAGDPKVPIIFQVDRIRDGRSFTTRRVLAIQHGQSIFALSASFQIDEPGIDHAVPIPQVPAPADLPTLPERIAVGDRPMAISRLPRAFDIRYVNAPPWESRAAGPIPFARNQVWFRADGTVPEDAVLHVCMLVYISDLTLLDSVMATHGLAHGFDRVQVASLDHAMWFHRPIRVDDWVLYDTESPSASGARGLAMGHLFASDGAMLATVVQEGLIRLR